MAGEGRENKHRSFDNSKHLFLCSFAQTASNLVDRFDLPLTCQILNKIDWFLIDFAILILKKKNGFFDFQILSSWKNFARPTSPIDSPPPPWCTSPGMSRAYLKHTPTSIELFLLHVKQPYGEIVGDFLRKFVGKKWRAL